MLKEKSKGWWPSEEDVKKISTREDLAEFIEKLRMVPFSEVKIENNDLDSYLEALGRNLSDIDGYFLNAERNMAKASPWEIMAIALLTAFIYE